MSSIVIIIGFGCLLYSWFGASAPLGSDTVSLQLLVGRLIAAITGIGFLIAGTCSLGLDSIRKLLNERLPKPAEKTSKDKAVDPPFEL